MSRIYCPVTGRSWPPEKIIDLKDCVRCGAKIDIRFEAWKDGPQHGNGCPTPQPALAPLEPPPPFLKAQTGADVVESMKKFRDTTHQAWLNDPATSQGDE